MADAWSDLIRGRSCINCGADDETIVPCHSNEQAHGKGTGLKAFPWTQIPLCRRCHYYLDHDADRVEARAFWLRNWAAHMKALISAGLVAPVGKTTRERKPERVEKMLKRDAWKERA